MTSHFFISYCSWKNYIYCNPSTSNNYCKKNVYALNVSLSLHNRQWWKNMNKKERKQNAGNEKEENLGYLVSFQWIVFALDLTCFRDSSFNNGLNSLPHTRAKYFKVNGKQCEYIIYTNNWIHLFICALQRECTALTLPTNT